MSARGAAAVLLAVALPAAGSAQPGAQAGHAMHAASAARAELHSLAATAARLTARYADRRVAVVDGYRRIGSDFPGMGEHWLHPVALLAGGVDPARPTMLTYATIDGRPRLIGLGFVVTTSGDAAPDVPGWPFAWHEHSGLLADESGAGRGPPDGRGSATHVWVLHAWTALENPDGRYAPDNWALPFARLGLDAPAGIDADAARALSLATGGGVYLRGVLADAGLLAAGG
ncbi:MAG: hypothetical protein ACJ8AO_14235, partial [Gemmatimonadaceae bacterium]